MEYVVKLTGPFSFFSPFHFLCTSFRHLSSFATATDDMSILTHCHGTYAFLTASLCCFSGEICLILLHLFFLFSMYCDFSFPGHPAILRTRYRMPVLDPALFWHCPTGCSRPTTGTTTVLRLGHIDRYGDTPHQCTDWRCVSGIGSYRLSTSPSYPQPTPATIVPCLLHYGCIIDCAELRACR